MYNPCSPEFHDPYPNQQQILVALTMTITGCGSRVRSHSTKAVQEYARSAAGNLHASQVENDIAFATQSRNDELSPSDFGRKLAGTIKLY